MKTIKFAFLVLVAVFMGVSTVNASFTLTAPQQTVISNALSGFPNSYKDYLVADTVNKNGLNALTNTGITTYVSYFGSSLIWNEDKEINIYATNAFTFEDFLSMDTGYLYFKGEDNGILLAVIDTGYLEALPMLESFIDNLIKGNVVFKDSVDKLLISSNTKELQIDGTTDTGSILPGYVTDAMKTEPINGIATGFWFKVKDRVGKRFFNVR